MNVDNLVLDTDSLRATAEILDVYAERQKSIIDDFFNNVRSLSGEWEDDETFSAIIGEIVSLQNKIYQKMDAVKNYASIFRMRAQAVEQRPKFEKRAQSESSTSSFQNVNVKGESYLMQSSIGSTYSSSYISLDSKKLDVDLLSEEISSLDGVENNQGYVVTTNNQTKINNLPIFGKFLCPKTGEEIVAKNIAYRGKGIVMPNGQNVCGADFYYKNSGNFCGSYTGTSWKDIFNTNYSETKQFREANK